jgi:hypothetical protein
MPLKDNFGRQRGRARPDRSDPKIAAPRVASQLVNATRHLSVLLTQIKEGVDRAGKASVLLELGSDADEFESTYEALRTALASVDPGSEPGAL